MDDGTRRRESIEDFRDHVILPLAAVGAIVVGISAVIGAINYEPEPPTIILPSHQPDCLTHSPSTTPSAPALPEGGMEATAIPITIEQGDVDASTPITLPSGTLTLYMPQC